MKKSIIKSFLSLIIVITVYIYSISNMTIVLATQGINDNMGSSDEEKIIIEVDIDKNFADNRLLVVLDKKHSGINKSFDNIFDGIENINSIVDLTKIDNNRKENQTNDENSNGLFAMEVNELNFHQILQVNLVNSSKQLVVDTIHMLDNIDGVLYAGPDYYSGEPGIIPNDSYYSSQWGLNKINAEEAWNITTGNSSVYVGVMDTGIAIHSDIGYNLTDGWDCANDSLDATDDVNGHGTHVAGIIGGYSNNSLGISGVSWRVKLVPLQISNDAGGSYTSYIVKAFTYAINHYIPIINHSWWNYYYDPAYKYAIANYPGIYVCIAGNAGNDIDISPNYPASYDLENMISVANTTDLDEFHDSSNYGETTVDLAAPGTCIYSTFKDNGYRFLTGTSMAAPHVTGVAALIMSIRPDLSATEIKSIILDNVDIVASLEGKCITGGRLNAYKAVRAATESRTFTGDVNGDGRADVILSRKIGNNRALTVYLGKTNGSFEEPITTNSSYSFVYSDPAFAGDFNGDGYTDVLIHWSSGGYRQLLVYISKGDGTFYEGVNLASTRAHNAQLYPCSFHIGDVNGDGKDDFIVHWRSTSGYRCALVYKGSSSSPYIIDATTNAIVSSDEYAFNEPVYVGDFNGDGLCDMIVHRSTTDNHRELIIYTGKTDAKFNSSVSLTSVQLFEPADYPTKNFVDDMNGDGKDDFIIQRKSSADYRYAYSYIGKNTSPYIIDASTYALSTTDICKDTDSVLTGDVNGDGKADLIVQWVNSLNKRQLMVYAGNSNNTFNSGINYSTTNNQIPSTYAGRFLVDDVNGDGRDDFIVKWRSGTNIRFLTYLGTTASSFTSGVYTVPTEDVPYYDCDSNGSRYKITCYGTTSCLNIYGDNLTYLNNHQNVTLWSDSGSNEQKWLISSIGDNVYIRSIIDETFGLNVYRVGSPFNCDVYPVSGNETDAAVDFISTSGGYRIKLHNYNLYLTASSSANGANVYWDSYSSSLYQIWSLTPAT